MDGRFFAVDSFLAHTHIPHPWVPPTPSQTRVDAHTHTRTRLPKPSATADHAHALASRSQLPMSTAPKATTKPEKQMDWNKPGRMDDGSPADGPRDPVVDGGGRTVGLGRSDGRPRIALAKRRTLQHFSSVRWAPRPIPMACTYTWHITVASPRSPHSRKAPRAQCSTTRHSATKSVLYFCLAHASHAMDRYSTYEAMARSKIYASMARSKTCAASRAESRVASLPTGQGIMLHRLSIANWASPPLLSRHSFFT